MKIKLLSSEIQKKKFAELWIRHYYIRSDIRLKAIFVIYGCDYPRISNQKLIIIALSIGLVKGLMLVAIIERSSEAYELKF